MNSNINSNNYWNDRFSNDWESYEGPRQSRFFAQLAIENLPPWLIEQVRKESLTVADWGCAQGDGTDLLGSYIPSQQLAGIDFSEVAVQQASTRYPAIRFLAKNWLDGEEQISERFDIVFSSNTLEHFHEPWKILESISKRSKKCVVLALPYRELERIKEHFYSFLPANIPEELENGFRLIWSRVVNCSQMPKSMWNGDQIFLAYAEKSWITSLKLRLDDFEIGKFDATSEISNLKSTLLANEALIRENNEKISSLNQEIIEKNNSLEDFKSYQQDKEIYIAQLRAELTENQPKAYKMYKKTLQRIKRVPQYTRTSMNIIKYRGIRGFLKALKNKVLNRHGGLQTSYIHPPAPVAGLPASPLLEGDLVIVTGVPFDDIGGGQRAAQLARCALKTGRRVVYLYIYKKFDFETNCHIESNVQAHGLTHLHINATSPEDVLRLVSSNSTVVFEFPHPAAIPYLKLFNTRGMRTIFELIDDWETSLGGDWFDLDIYRQFVAESKVVVGTAKLLVERLQQNNRSDAIYLPNAANEYIFDKYKTYSRPKDLPTEWKRIGLYFGSLYGEWFAWDYLKEAATKNPETDFILIGDRPEGKSMPSNVRMLGAKNIEELPGYLAHSDFCILPFSPGKISDAVSPIKIFEYLFSGKKVISTNLPEVNGYPGVFIANSPEHFAELCSNFETSEIPSQENDKFISQHSWFSRLDALIGGGQAERFQNSVSVVILIYNNKKIIGRCLETLIHHCHAYLKEIIVVDNSSSDGGAEYVEANFPSVKLLRNPVNGCSSGRNLGATSATGKYLAFFDSDQWFTSSSCFEEALTLIERDANVGAIGWGAGWFDKGRSDLGGMIADYCPNRGMNSAAIMKGYRADIGYLATCGFFMPKVVFDATSGFDTFYDPTCFEDTDLSFQVTKLGFDVCYRDLTGIRHQPHQTTGANSGSDAYNKLFNRNARYFKEKWKNHPSLAMDYSE